ncbi:hypothetical protein ACVIGB_005400 [Bradyrhizobium sp. USDA 4341]
MEAGYGVSNAGQHGVVEQPLRDVLPDRVAAI